MKDDYVLNMKFEEAHTMISDDPERALDALNDLYNISPDADIVHDLIYLHCLFKDMKMALRLLDEYKHYEQNEARYFHDKGYVYFKMKDYEASLLFFLYSQKLSENDWRTSLNIGNNYLMLKKYKLAIKYYTSSYKQNKGIESILGYCLANMGLCKSVNNNLIEIIGKIYPNLGLLLINTIDTDEWNEVTLAKIICKIK